MILINKNTGNNVVLTLTESIEGNDSYDFLFQFINDTTGQVKVFHATDISTIPLRYNRFDIVENDTENLYNGTVSLNPVGYWSYKIYQMPISSPIDLNPANSIKLLETGKVLVKSECTIDPTFNIDDDRDNVVFDIPD